MFTSLLKTRRARIIFILINIMFVIVGTAAAYYTMVYRTRAASGCMSGTQVQSDPRCLYIYSNKIYEKGTRQDPHHGHPCGMDVSSIIPASHTSDTAMYLDDTYVDELCTGNNGPENSPTPGGNVTNTPSPTATPTPTRTLTPTSSFQASNSSISAVSTATPTPVPIVSVTPSVTLSPTPNFSIQSSPATPSPTPTVFVPTVPLTPIIIYQYVTATPSPTVYGASPSATFEEPVQTGSSGLTVKGSPPGSTPWKLFSIPAALILIGLIL